MSRQKAPGAVVAFAVSCILISLLVYAKAFDNPFRQDDFTFLRHVETHGMPGVLSPGPEFAFYRPGSVALFALEHAGFGRHSGFYIAFNYILHAGIAVLVFLALRRLYGRDAAAVASALFLVGLGHYGKQVMWACTSGPLMSTGLCVAAILVLLRGAEPLSTEKVVIHNQASRTMVAVGLLAFAMLFHEAALAMCAIGALLVVTDAPDRQRWKHAVPFLALPVAALALWLTQTRQAGYHAVPPGEAIVNAPVQLVSYLGFMLMPLQPTALVDGARTAYVLAHVAPVARTVLGIAMLVALLYIVVRRHGTVRLLALWLLVAMLPYTVLRSPTHHLDLRYLYPASIPFCALAVMVLISLRDRGSVTRLMAGAITILAVAGSAALQLILESRYDQWR